MLWVFTDQVRLPDPIPLIARLPPGLCGIVLRPDAEMTTRQVRRIARLCRARRVALTVAGRWARDAGPGVGAHMSRGWPSTRKNVFRTSSAHGVAELARSQAAGAAFAFLSPTYATKSHPGAPGLGSIRWEKLANKARLPVFALGGITGATVRHLSCRHCAGAGVIGAAV